MLLDFGEVRNCTNGAVRFGMEDGWFSFDRFSEAQEALFLPGYREDSTSTASVCVEFMTDADAVSFDWRAERSLAGDTVQSNFCVNGFLTDCFARLEDQEPGKCGSFSAVLPAGTNRVAIRLSNRSRVLLKNITLENATAAEPIPYSLNMICQGDSITQGHCVEHPAMSFVNRLADKLNAHVVNKGVGGLCFHPQLLRACREEPADLVTVAFGTNDWFASTREEFLAATKQYNELLHEMYADIPVFVITPLWRGDWKDIKLSGTFDEMTDVIKETFRDFHVIDGTELVPHFPEFFADKYLHPGYGGDILYADALYDRIIKVIQTK